MILVDTCVISEVRHPNANPAVVASFRALAPEEVFFSVITIGEIAAGVARVGGNRAASLEQWLDGLVTQFNDRILGIDSQTARQWGELTAIRRAMGEPLPAADGLIAATARQHNLPIMTRNVADFDGCGLSIINPWDGQPPAAI